MQYSFFDSSSPALAAFWLMKVSIATAVLPVWRSPMISSRWPRPTGTRASIALRPVCTGSCTDLRGMMPGALTSTRVRVASTIGPLPSIGLPRASTTRPSRPLPTGTSTIVPVRLTTSPSLISASEPKITTPTLSASRFRAMPFTPLANSTISPAWTLSRPWMRAMPSPTERTDPTSETWASVPKLAIWSLMTFEISAARISMFCTSWNLCGPLGLHRLGERIETGADRAVDHLAADLDDEATKDFGIDAGLELDRLAGTGLQLFSEGCDLCIVERVSAGDFGAGFGGMGGSDLAEGADHVGQGREAAVRSEHAEELLRKVAKTEQAGNRIHCAAGCIAAKLRVADQALEVSRFAQCSIELLEIAFDRRNEALFIGQIEQCRGVTP